MRSPALFNRRVVVSFPTNHATFLVRIMTASHISTSLKGGEQCVQRYVLRACRCCVCDMLVGAVLSPEACVHICQLLSPRSDTASDLRS